MSVNKQKALRWARYVVPVDAISSRNLTSIGLVALFFAIFVAMGGKVTWKPPRVDPYGRFGAAAKDPNDKFELRGDVRKQADAASADITTAKPNTLNNRIGAGSNAVKPGDVDDANPAVGSENSGQFSSKTQKRKQLENENRLKNLRGKSKVEDGGDGQGR